MKNIFTILFFLGLSFGLNAQDIVQVSIGANYSNQVYYSLADDATVTVDNNAWDLAFALTSPFEAGVHVNESVNISFTGVPPKTLLYAAYTNNFEDVLSAAERGDSLYNDESNWPTGGALNIQADPNNPGDYGWGEYNPDNHVIEGNRIFIIQLRDESYRKFIVESLTQGVYTLKYANLDGSDEKTISIDKADYPDHHLILFSFLDGAVISDLPTQWDLVFQRYSDLDPSNVGVMVEYTVTGILTAPGVLSAEVNGVDDPEALNFEDYLDSLDAQLDIIGQDWKYFSFESGWVIIEDRVFYVKTADNHLWQLYMYDFEGSSTGTYTFAKWDLGMIAGVDDVHSNFESITLVPNPVASNASFNLVLESKASQKAYFSILSLDGRMIAEYEKDMHSGLNAFSIPTQDIPSGQYYLNLRTANEQIVRKLMVK